jgi:tetratricopeptide (TPR) repeat protein
VGGFWAPMAARRMGRHTRCVRRLVLIAVLGLAGRAHADLIKAPPPPDPEHGSFWRNIVAPHAGEVAAILVKVRAALNQADNALASDYDPSGQEHVRFYREVLGPLRYARRLQPDNVDVLRLYAQACDELGMTREAVEALQAALDVTGTLKAPTDITRRLGIIYLRLGRLDDAIRYLRMAQAPLTPQAPLTAQVLVHLSNALAARGQTGEAIDVLANTVPLNLPYYSTEAALVAFALAVQYDRDEQHGAAFDVLDRMQSVLQGQMAALVQTSLAQMRFAPAEDQHYYLGLLYEAVGSYTEARAEWALYAAGGDLPYRGRALQHIAAIDALRRAPPPAPPPLLPPVRFHRSPVP